MLHLLDHKLNVGLQQDGATPHVQSEVIKYLPVLWFGWLAAGMSLWTSGCSPKAIQCGFCGGQSGSGIVSVLPCQ